MTAASDTKPWGVRKCAGSQGLPGLSHNEHLFQVPAPPEPKIPDAPLPSPLLSPGTFHKLRAREPLAVPIRAWYTGHSTSLGCRHGGQGARLITLLPARTAIPGLDEAVGLGAVGERGGGTRPWPWLGGAGRTPRVLLRDQTTYCPAPVWLPLPHGYHFPLAALPGPLTHLMGSSWRDLVSLGWQDTQRNLVTVPSFRSRMPISPGDPRGCERPKASRGISLRGWEEAEAEAGPGKSLS